MSDQATNRPEQSQPERPLSDRSFGVGKGKGDSSQLRLVTADGHVVFPEDAEPTDDSPTIISKNKPSQAVQAAPPTLSGSLRGRKLAHFELLEPIGVGGMAAVIRARDTQLERFVALKILPPEMAEDEENIRRFHQEARAAAKLDHENIARVFYCGEDQRLHFIAFEFVEGQNLRVLLEKRGRLPVGEAVRIILQVATGLEHAASRGVVHRDVKPSNIILSPNGRAKIVDMGLARSLEPRSEHDLTQSGVTLGTFDYISPEQALEPRDADSRSDIYSLGCTFYHMLTGQPPVPEGTAMKKLNAHQHTAPIDPRQLNPEIPAEVAAIMGRMMAKDPKDRYQRPVHLVQHLMQVAQKVGAADDVPEGVLFVDAPVPGDPHKRPLLTISLAALGLAAVLALLSLAPQPQRPVDFPKKGPNGIGAVPIKPEIGGVAPKVGMVHTDKNIIKSSQDLYNVLNERGPAVQALLENKIEVTDGDLIHPADSNRNVHIYCPENTTAKTITFKFSKSGTSEANEPIFGLPLDGGTIKFSNIRFEIDIKGDQSLPTQTVAMLGIRGTTTVRFHKCTFVQKDTPVEQLIGQNGVPIASIAVDTPGLTADERPRIVLENCSFTGGQVAISVNGVADIKASECAFKPYSALVHLRGDNTEYGTSVALDRCSAFVINGPAFRLDGLTTCDLAVKQSIFSRPDNAPSEERDLPDLIRQTENTKLAVHFDGQRNCYHGLNLLLVCGPQPRAAVLDEFRAAVQENKGRDKDSSLLPKETTIWASVKPWEEPSLDQAFKLKSDVREVRTLDGTKALGFEKCVRVVMAPLPPLADEPRVADVKLGDMQRLVDPDAVEDAAARIHKSLYSALGAAQAGETILIKQGKSSPHLQVKPTAIDNLKNLTLKPYPGHAPILNLDNTLENDTAFFRMFDGTLQIEQLEFLLEADQSHFDSMTIVYLGGNGVCTFRNCVFTLQTSAKFKREPRVPLSVVTLPALEKVMKMPQRPPRDCPEIKFDNCFVRGDGDVLTARGSRALKLDVDNSLLALSGSLLTVLTGAKDAVESESQSVNLKKVCAFHTDRALFSYRTAKGKGLVPTHVVASDSLFVNQSDRNMNDRTSADRPLAQFETADMTEENVLAALDWEGDKNVYCNYDRMLLANRPDETLPFFQMYSPRWTQNYKDTEAKFLTTAVNLAARPLWLTSPDVFLSRPESELARFATHLNADVLPKAPPVKKDPPVAP